MPQRSRSCYSASGGSWRRRGCSSGPDGHSLSTPRPVSEESLPGLAPPAGQLSALCLRFPEGEPVLVPPPSNSAPRDMPLGNSHARTNAVWATHGQRGHTVDVLPMKCRKQGKRVIYSCKGNTAQSQKHNHQRNATQKATQSTTPPHTAQRQVELQDVLFRGTSEWQRYKAKAKEW